MAEFQALIDALIRADERIDLFEWSVQKSLKANFSKVESGSLFPAWSSLRQKPSSGMFDFLGAIAHFGGNPEDAEKATKKDFALWIIPKPAGLPSVEKCDLKAMNEALPKLSKMTPLANVLS